MNLGCNSLLYQLVIGLGGHLFSFFVVAIFDQVYNKKTIKRLLFNF